MICEQAVLTSEAYRLKHFHFRSLEPLRKEAWPTGVDLVRR